MAATEQNVREQLTEGLAWLGEEYGGEATPERVVPLGESEFLTSDEGLALYYPDGSVWTVSVVCYRRPTEPGPEDV